MLFRLKQLPRSSGTVAKKMEFSSFLDLVTARPRGYRGNRLQMLPGCVAGARAALARVSRHSDSPKPRKSTEKRESGYTLPYWVLASLTRP